MLRCFRNELNQFGLFVSLFWENAVENVGGPEVHFSLSKAATVLWLLTFKKHLKTKVT